MLTALAGNCVLLCELFSCDSEVGCSFEPVSLGREMHAATWTNHLKVLTEELLRGGETFGSGV